MSYKVDNRALDLRERMYFPEVIRGIAIASGHFFKNLLWSRDTIFACVLLALSGLVAIMACQRRSIASVGCYGALHGFIPPTAIEVQEFQGCTCQVNAHCPATACPQEMR